MTHTLPQPDLVDLHVHSNVSDGTFSPREVVERAAEVGLKAVALTDHDTTARGAHCGGVDVRRTGAGTGCGPAARAQAAHAGELAEEASMPDRVNVRA